MMRFLLRRNGCFVRDLFFGEITQPKYRK